MGHRAAALEGETGAEKEEKRVGLDRWAWPMVPQCSGDTEQGQAAPGRAAETETTPGSPELGGTCRSSD